MRILAITNYYPPCQYSWGYQQLCEEITDGLSARGHTLAVLTSTYRDGDETAHPYLVRRLLCIDPDWHRGRPASWQFFVGHRQRERRDVAHLRQMVAEFDPEVIFFWHTVGLSKMLIREAEQLPGVTVAHYLADYTPELPDEYIAYWQGKPVHWSARLLKRPLSRLALYLLAREGKPVSLKYETVICVSDYMRRRLVSQGLIPADAVVIHNGVDLKSFSPPGGRASISSSVGLLCLVAGRVVREKGIHTVIEALACLQAQAELDGIALTILGDGPADYLGYLREKVCDDHLQDVVEFRSPVPREQMPVVLARYHVLILPSEYAEPLARAGQEAMAMGLLVIGTTAGGSGELLAHEKTGLVFEPGNPASLATQLSRARHEPDLAARLAEAGRQTVARDFNIQRTIEQVEDYLLNRVGGKDASQRQEPSSSVTTQPLPPFCHCEERTVRRSNLHYRAGDCFGTQIVPRNDRLGSYLPAWHSHLLFAV